MVCGMGTMLFLRWLLKVEADQEGNSGLRHIQILLSLNFGKATESCNHLENRVFQKAKLAHIASYLGITQQGLSRIRKNLVH